MKHVGMAQIARVAAIVESMCPRGGRPVRREIMASLLVSSGLLAAACGGGSSGTSSFQPGGGSPTPTSSAATSSQPGADSLVMPPFGKNARIVMTPWLPASASEARAVITAKNFLLAVLY